MTRDDDMMARLRELRPKALPGALRARLTSHQPNVIHHRYWGRIAAALVACLAFAVVWWSGELVPQGPRIAPTRVRHQAPQGAMPTLAGANTALAHGELDEYLGSFRYTAWNAERPAPTAMDR